MMLLSRTLSVFLVFSLMLQPVASFAVEEGVDGGTENVSGPDTVIVRDEALDVRTEALFRSIPETGRARKKILRARIGEWLWLQRQGGDGVFTSATLGDSLGRVLALRSVRTLQRARALEGGAYRSSAIEEVEGSVSVEELLEVLGEFRLRTRRHQGVFRRLYRRLFRIDSVSAQRRAQDFGVVRDLFSATASLVGPVGFWVLGTVVASKIMPEQARLIRDILAPLMLIMSYSFMNLLGWFETSWRTEYFLKVLSSAYRSELESQGEWDTSFGNALSFRQIETTLKKGICALAMTSTPEMQRLVSEETNRTPSPQVRVRVEELLPEEASVVEVEAASRTQARAQEVE